MSTRVNYMTNVRIKKPNELNLKDEIQIFEDGLRTGKESGNYEWWYFDSKYADGSSLVVIFFSKPVTSLKGKFEPYVSFDFVSKNYKEIHTEFKCNDYSMSKEKCDIRIGESYIKGDLNHYDICFKNDEVEAHITLDASVPSWRPYSGHLYFNEKEYFAWLPAVPEGKVKANIKIKNEEINLEGTGYHDHNWGNKLMIFLMNDWYWGRAKIGDYVVVSAYIYANKKDEYVPTPIFMLAKDGEIIADDAYKYLSYEEKDFIKDSYTKRYVANTIIYDYNDKDNNKHYRITYKKSKEEVERKIMKDIVGKPLSILFYLLGFRCSYHRMCGTTILEKFENDKVTESIECPAMWEQMCFRKDRIKL